jgi:lysophospholipase L1-like esterase
VAADAVRILFLGEKLIKITSPSNRTLKTSGRVFVQVCAGGFPDNWGVELILDGNPTRSRRDYQPPFELELDGLSRAGHTIDAYMVDDQGIRQESYLSRVKFGVGDSYVALGDSITRGSMDDYGADDISKDGRNRGGGYEPILNDLLTTKKGYPHTVVNEGVSGYTSEDGAKCVGAVLTANPDAQRFLILYGTNDAGIPIPSGMGLAPGQQGYRGSYKDNMQQIISAISQSGKTPLLAKVPISLGDCPNCSRFLDPNAAPRNVLIREYNAVIEELLVSNNIHEEPPDFYGHFHGHATEFADLLHLNGAGYRSMANLWFNSLAILP